MASPEPRAATAHLFGQLAIEMGLVNGIQLDQGLRQQAESRQLKLPERQCRLGEILIRQKVLTPEQVREVLAVQRKRRQEDDAVKLPVEQFGDFKLLERLGEGNMGVVFKARNVLTGQIVALKVLKQGMGVNKEYLERFKREQEAAEKMRHPNIVMTVDCGLVKAIQFIAMEFVEGETLRARLKREGKLPEKEAVRISINVAQALTHAHNQGWVHRDIKPENILMGEGGVVKLADLGLAKSVFGDAGLTHTGQVVGTPYYIAPEQARGERTLDPRSDLYSLGCTLYNMLTGRLPFEASSPMEVLMLHIQGTLVNPHDLAPELSDGVVRLVVKLLAKDMTDRYESAEKLIEDLERIHRNEPPQYTELAANRSSILPPDPNRFKKMVLEKQKAEKSGGKSGCLGLLTIGVGITSLAYWLESMI